ncbi:MAG: hypothetical protein QXF52_02250 [Thermoproteota archaeon]
MNVTLDNIFAFFVLILILVTFIGYIIPSTYLSFNTVEEHQLEEVAQSIIDKMLLNPGYPDDWGNITKVNYDSNLLSFGLQKAGGAPYELDVDKVQRIVNVGDYQLPLTVRVNYSRIAELLGLGNEYGFSIRIRPALNISVFHARTYVFKKNEPKKQNVTSVVNVVVKTPEGRPAIGANVTGLYIFMNVRNKGGEKDEAYVNYTYRTNVTRWDGSTTIDFTSYLQALEGQIGQGQFQKAIPAIVVYAEYYGIRAISSKSLGEESDALKGTVVGNYMIVDYNIELLDSPRGAAHVKNATGLSNPPYYVYLGSLINDTKGESGMVVNRGAKQHRVYKISAEIDDDVAFMIVPVKKEGENKMIILFRPPFDAVCQRGWASGNIKTGVLKRMIRMGSFHYIVEVRVWRWGEIWGE